MQVYYSLPTTNYPLITKGEGDKERITLDTSFIFSHDQL